MKTIIEMAREAGFMLVAEPSVEGSDWYECFTEEIEDFAALVRADEREACAKLFPQPYIEYCGEEIQAIIQARGNT